MTAGSCCHRGLGLDLGLGYVSGLGVMYVGQGPQGLAVAEG